MYKNIENFRRLRKLVMYNYIIIKFSIPSVFLIHYISRSIIDFNGSEIILKISVNFI